MTLKPAGDFGPVELPRRARNLSPCLAMGRRGHVRSSTAGSKGGKGSRRGRGSAPQPPQPAAAWLPETARRRDELHSPLCGQSSGRERPITDAEVVAVADRVGLPDTAPAYIGSSLATRDTSHQVTLPGFSPMRRCMFVAKRPVAATFYVAR